MTEAEWLICTDPHKMLEFLMGKVSNRKLRLFLCAHLRMAPSSPAQAFRSQLADVLERLADGLMGSESALQAMIPGMNEIQWGCIERQDFEMAAYLRECFNLLKLACGRPDTGMGLIAREFDHPTLHDLFDPYPFRPVAIDPAWLTWNDGTVKKIAQAIYDERAFDRLTILADALEEAGCTNPDILAHCRQPGEHVRGCWVVDMILGKE